MIAATLADHSPSQPAPAAAATALPSLREELNLFEAAPHADGSPSWSLHDPVRNQFFRIDWPTFEILARWSLGKAEDILAAIADETPLDLEPEDVVLVQRFLLDNQLCQMHTSSATEYLVKREKARHSSMWQWLLHHYLFFRVPLVKPDRWLTRWAPRVAPFFSKGFFQLTALALVFGVLTCLRQWEQFSATLLDTFSLAGALSYALALSFVKTLHELGHAFTAKRKGCRVPTMGVAFLVMWPVAYTDVNEVWKLKSRKDRLAVGAAGMATELVVAAWATLLWGLLPDGGLRSACFVLATITWISTLLVNISPFMRFDGYFLLSDFFDFPNLHARSFALARWDLRERLFALGEQAPEHFSPPRRNALIVFAWLVWLYRLMLFLGIAVLVYHFFIKLVGVVLFAVEIGVFVLLPVWRELGEWRQRTAQIRQSRRAKRLLYWGGGVLLLGLVPWSTQISSQGLLRTTALYPVYVPNAARIVALPYANGSQVKAGDVLMELESPDANYRAEQAQHRAERLAWQMEVSGLEEAARSRLGVTREEWVGAQAEHAGLRRERERFTLRAPFDGVITDINPELATGVWVNRQERLALLVSPRQWQVETYLEETEVQRIRVGDSGRFYGESPGSASYALRVIRIDPDASRQLPDPILSAQHGGQLLTRERNGQLIPDKALYRVVLEVHAADEAARIQRGQIVIHGEGRTLLGHYLRSGLSVLIRESGW